jgi:RHS repeat-associated protein
MDEQMTIHEHHTLAGVECARGKVLRGIGLLIALCGLQTVGAQASTLSVEPQFFYGDPNLTPKKETDAGAAFADVANLRNHCDPAYCYYVANLQADTTGSYAGITTVNGRWFTYWYDYVTCAIGGSCVTAPKSGVLALTFACSVGFGMAGHSDGSTARSYQCQKTIPDPKPCTKCRLGNPIDGSVGEKIQDEVDYSGPSGLRAVRSYRSGLGAFSGTSTAGFVNFSQAIASGACVPTEYVDPNTQGLVGYCAHYFTFNVTQPSYLLATTDGRFIQFTGPNSALIQSADINERAVQVINGSGAIEWHVTREDDSTEIYNASGVLSQKVARNGQVTTYTYSTASTPPSIAPYPGLLLTQTDAFGHTLSWQYNALGQISKMIDPAGGIYQYAYDTTGNLTAVTYPDNSTKTYWYNELANTGGVSLPTALTGITDESAARYATFQYQSANGYTFAVNTQHAGGVDSYSFAYNAGVYYGSPVTSAVVTDPLGAARTYQFQTNLTYNVDQSQTQPAASGSGTVTKSQTYDANGNVASETDYNGNMTTHVYDLTRNLETSRTEASGTPRARTITTTWHPSFRIPATITEPNRTTSYTFDASGNALTKTVTDTSVTPNVTRVWSYTYDNYGRMLTADGPRTDVVDKTTFTYFTCTTGYQCGHINTVTNAAGQVTTYNTYNAHGQPLTITDPNGVVTTLTYDARLRLKTRQVGTETTTIDYYPTGLLQKVTLPDSSFVQYTYDAAHRLTQISDGLGNKLTYTLDAMGNRTAESAYDPLNVLSRTRSRVFNVLNQQSQDIGAAGTMAVTTTYGYDDNGNRTSVNAPMSRNTMNLYDELNHLKQITDPANGVTQFAYDGNDNLTTVTDPRSLATTYTFTGFGDLKTQTSPDTGGTTKTYDSGGNLATSTDSRGAISTYTYDTLNRVKTVAFKIGSTTDQTITYTYDAGTNGKGRLTGASDSNHSMTWVYDTLGRVTSKGQTLGSVTKTIGYVYTNGDMTTETMPSGQTVTYSYTNGQVSQISVNGTVLLSNVVYEPFGPVRGWTWGNGTALSRLHDTDGNQSQINSAEVMAFGYDSAFRMTSLSNSTVPGASATYGYDALDRLNTAGGNAGTYGWTYDANGNRLTQTGTSATTLTISASSNRVNSTTGTLARTYTYDSTGNTLTYGMNTFTYYNSGRMKTAKVGSSTTTYVYNAVGQRVKKSGGVAGTVLYMFDETGHLIGEYSSTGVLVQETVWLGDIPVATIRPGTPVVVYYLHANHLNTPTAVTRPSDNKFAWQWHPDGFGVGAPGQNPQGLGTFVYNLRFPGQYYDQETGQYYNYMRDLDPQTGRYIESDPAGIHGGPNTYLYASANPISNVDPFGLETMPGSGKPKSYPNCLKWPSFPAKGCNCAEKCSEGTLKFTRGCISDCRWRYTLFPGGAALLSGVCSEASQVWAGQCLENCTR